MAFAYAAETLDYTLLVQLKDGNNVEFLFSSTPVATFEEGEMTITCNGGTNSEKFIISNVERMTVESSLSGITQIDTKGYSFFRHIKRQTHCLQSWPCLT